MMNFASALFVAALLLAAAGQSNDGLSPLDQWPHWRGPLATGAAPHGNPPIHWDEKTNIKWKAPLPGRGSATPIVWGDCVFVAAALDTGRVAQPADIPKVEIKQEIKTKRPTRIINSFCSASIGKRGNCAGNGFVRSACPMRAFKSPTATLPARPPPTVNASGCRSVRAEFTATTLRASLLWQRDLGLFYPRYGFGEASTPVLHGNDLVLNGDQEINSRLIVLDASTGQTRLQVDRDEPTSWNTPLVVDYKGQTQVILNGTKRVRSYDSASGKPLWQVGGMTINAIPSAVAADGVAYIMAGYGGSLAVAVPLDARGELTGTDKLLWQHQKGTPYVPSPLLVAGKLYFTQSNENPLTCLDAKTGKPLFLQERLHDASSFYASPVAAAGRIYLVDRTGVGLVLKQSDKVEVLATNRLDDNIDASPAVAGRQLFLRGYKHLYCIEQP